MSLLCADQVRRLRTAQFFSPSLYALDQSVPPCLMIVGRGSIAVVRIDPDDLRQVIAKAAAALGSRIDFSMEKGE